MTSVYDFKKDKFCRSCNAIQSALVRETLQRVSPDDYDYMPSLAYGPQSWITYDYHCSVCGAYIEMLGSAKEGRRRGVSAGAEAELQEYLKFKNSLIRRRK